MAGAEVDEGAAVAGGCGRADARPWKIIRIESLPTPAGRSFHQLRFDAAGSPLLGQAEPVAQRRMGVDSDAALIEGGPHTFAFSGTPGLQQGVMRAAPARDGASISSRGRHECFWPCLRKEAVGMQRTAPLLRAVGSGGGSASAKRSNKGRGDRFDRYNSAWPRASWQASSRGVAASVQRTRWPGNRAHQAGPRINGAAARRREARPPETLLTAQRRSACCTPRAGWCPYDPLRD